MHDKKENIKVQPLALWALPTPPRPSPKGEGEARGESQSEDRCRLIRQALFPFDKGKYPKGEGLE
ncbi:hypothetical protein D0T84_11975 [Dysgonomonas sp. 521]|nr:hypothetical protein [Dysgonomonas sp. 521]